MTGELLTSETGAVAKRGPAQLPGVLETLRGRSLIRLGALLRGMFERLESILYEWAKNLPDAEQQRYMDIILDVRRRRADMEAQFGRTMGSAFMSLGHAPGQPGQAFDKVDYESLSLVKTEDMDITVTIDTMVARIRLDLATPLSLLRRRFAHLLPKVDVSEKSFPLDPGVIANAFKASCDVLDLGVEQKLVVLRVFQQLVLGDLGKVLEDANQILIDAGVLPDLKVALAGGGKTDGAKPKNAQERAAEDAEKAKRKAQLDTEEMFAFLQDILAVGHASSGLAAATAGLNGNAPGSTPLTGVGANGGHFHGGHYVGGGGIGGLPAAAIGGSVASVPIMPQNIAPSAVVQPVATPDLVALLSQIQQHQPKAALKEDDSTPSVTEVRESIRDNLRSDQESVEAIKQADEDVINLVSMLFDFILDDDDLPTAMKALIGRLQIPLLKVAILDKSFFNAESHPARRLLNTLAKAGIGWSQRDPGGDVLYSKIEEVVFRILNEFIDDLDLFSELLQEFTAFFEQQQKREEAVDKRTRDAEEGRARADLARAMVQQTLNRRLTGRQLPVVAVKILQEAWRNVLYLACLREGTESESWKQAVKVVDALIWSVSPQPGAEWLARLRDVSPKLMNSLKRGLASANYDALMTESLLRELTQVHLELIAGEEMRTVSVLDPKAAAAKPAVGMVEAHAVAATKPEEVQAIVLPTAEPAGPAQPLEALPGDDENVVTVSRLNVGSWVEFMESDRRDRHKLVARIRSVDKLIFANRRGIKVAEMTGMKLAVDLSLGRARVVEEAEVVDKALESVIGSLRDIKAQQVAPS